MTRHIGQPEPAAAVEESELFVFDAEQVEDGGVQVIPLPTLSTLVFFSTMRKSALNELLIPGRPAKSANMSSTAC